MQAFHGFAVRTSLDSVFRVGLFANRWPMAGELLGVTLMTGIRYLARLQVCSRRLRRRR